MATKKLYSFKETISAISKSGFLVSGFIRALMVATLFVPVSLFARKKAKEVSFQNKLTRAQAVALRHQKLSPDVSLPEQKIVVLIPSYNNHRWVKQNLDSVFNQNYSNYRVVYVDDCSPDDTGLYVQAYIRQHNQEQRLTLISNTERRMAMANIYHAIHEHCDDDEIVVMLDGDDFLAHSNVLKYVNHMYTTKDVWLAYGNYIRLSSAHIFGRTKPFPKEVIENNTFRTCRLGIQHLRTFKAWLFKRIKKDDLLYNGQFFAMSSDVAMYTPMIEMAAHNYCCIRDVLYIYNDLNPINDHKKDKKLQLKLDIHIRNKTKYDPITYDG